MDISVIRIALNAIGIKTYGDLVNHKQKNRKAICLYWSKKVHTMGYIEVALTVYFDQISNIVEFYENNDDQLMFTMNQISELNDISYMWSYQIETLYSDRQEYAFIYRSPGGNLSVEGNERDLNYFKHKKDWKL